MNENPHHRPVRAARWRLVWSRAVKLYKSSPFVRRVTLAFAGVALGASCAYAPDALRLTCDAAASTLLRAVPGVVGAIVDAATQPPGPTCGPSQVCASDGGPE